MRNAGVPGPLCRGVALPFRNGLSLATALALAACSAPVLERSQPSIDLPGAWSGPAGAGAPLRAPERWWLLFDDPALAAMIEEALGANRDLRAAAARIVAAEAAVALAEADRYPVVSGGATRARTRSTQRGAVPLFPGVPVESNNMRGVLSASWETDFWGRYARAADAARAELLASESGRASLALTLTTEVARTVFDLRRLDAQRAVAEQTLATRDEFARLTARRVEAGVASEYELSQVEAERDNARLALASIAREREGDAARLAVLLGRSPRDAWRALTATASAGTTAPGVIMPVEPVPAGLPSDLLARRPDIREAEARLAAADARIAAARAAYFPSIVLTGTLGTESAALTNLFTGPARIWQFAAALSQPIWNAGRLDAQVKSVSARRDELIAAYEKTVQNAFADVRVALAAHAAARATWAAQEARRASLARALQLARLRLDNGVATLLDVLDAERNLLAAELGRVDALYAERGAVADLVKALGGGWKDVPGG